MIDIKSKENAHIAKYFDGKKALIIDPIGVNRTSIKKTLLNLGLTHKNIGNVDNVEGAKDYFEIHKPDLMFVKDDLEDGKGLELLQLHIEKVPNRLKGSFFLISEDNSLAESTVVLDTECEGILIVPFTIQAIEETIMDSLKRKFKPSPYYKAIELGKEKLYRDDKESALEKFNEACELNPKPVLANYYKSLILLEQGDDEEAEKVLLENLSENEKHYKTLTELGKFYFDKSRFPEAYDMECRVLEHYPLNPEKIPVLTRLSVQTENYEDITNFASLFQKLNKVGDKIKKFMCAGIAICGRFFIMSERNEEGEKMLEQAAKMSGGRITVLRSVAESLLKYGSKDKAISVLEKHANDKTDENELRVLFFEIEAQGAAADKVINDGRKLINEGIKQIKIFDCMIEALIVGGANFEKVEDLVFEAKREFPDEANYFEEKLEAAKKAA